MKSILKEIASLWGLTLPVIPSVTRNQEASLSSPWQILQGRSHPETRMFNDENDRHKNKSSYENLFFSFPLKSSSFLGIHHLINYFK